MEKLMPFTSIERAKHGTIPRHNIPLIYMRYTKMKIRQTGYVS
jgi:hypothetical protein